MLLSEKDRKRFNRRLLESRLRILCRYGFYGSLLMHVDFGLDSSCRNVAASSRKISFSPAFLDQISDQELDLVLMHEVCHLALKHNHRRRDFSNKEVFDLAADIVTNSNLLKSFDMKLELLSLNGETLNHTAPSGKEGYEYSVEQLYRILSAENGRSYDAAGESDTEEGSSEDPDSETGFDDHSRWPEEEDSCAEREWQQYVGDICETILIRDPSNNRGTLPMFAMRMFKQLRDSRIDWRIILRNCLEEEISDYSFLPPDRRFSNSDFFFPGMNDLEETVKGVLFFIDTSGSMSDSQITTAFSEVKGAVEQFSGRLKGMLGFFDCAVIKPVPFESVESLMKIKPYGGGGTDFSIVFDYVRDHMKGEEIAQIIIMTDGEAPWPPESASGGIPVIWMINNERNDPPWGKVIRLPKDSTNQKYS